MKHLINQYIQELTKLDLYQEKITDQAEYYITQGKILTYIQVIKDLTKNE
jgi:hypothetical protein